MIEHDHVMHIFNYVKHSPDNSPRYHLCPLRNGPDNIDLNDAEDVCDYGGRTPSHSAIFQCLVVNILP